MIQLVDSHCHLQFPDFEKDAEPVIARAKKAGVRWFINVGSDLGASRKAIEQADRFPECYATVGIHPHDAASADEKSFDELRKLARHPKVVAIGEVGLDYFRNLSSPEIQKAAFTRFIDLARELDLPLILHIRDAYDDVLNILSECASGQVRGVSHCFSSNADMMRKLLDLGLYISFAGPVTYKKNDELRQAARFCPNDRILVETDAPYLPPQSRRGIRNEPAYMVETAGRLAEIKGMDVEALAEVTTGNVIRLFKIQGLC